MNFEQMEPSPQWSSRGISVLNRPIDEITPDPNNPRIHPKRQIQQIANSIKTFGFNIPILVDSNSKVIAGHGRLAAARLLGMTHVPTIRIDHLTEQEIRAFNIADNRLTENAEWDERLLGEQFKILSTQNLTFDLEITGFEIPAIDMYIEGVSAGGSGKADPADRVPELRFRSQVTHAGDVWKLDDHRVACGDGRDEAAFQSLMGGKKAEMVFVDPPYNDRIDRYVSNFGEIQHPEFPMASGEMGEQQFTRFLEAVCAQLRANSTEAALQFICMDWRHAFQLLTATRSVYSELKNICVWTKNRAGQGSLYRSQHEFVFVFKPGRSSHRNNVQLGRHGRYRTNVWSYPVAVSPSQTADEDSLKGIHPTIKPVSLVADAILDCSARGDIVLDSFLGSGTTLIAAERTGRVCYGMELDPHYVDVIVRRWESFTGQSAILESSGKRFDEIAEESDGREA